MAILSGKRKRRDEINSAQIVSQDGLTDERLQALLRKHFETQFEPLDVVNHEEHPAEGVSDAESDRETDEDDWEGLSDATDTRNVEIVHHSTSLDVENALSKRERKSFMSNKPPSTSSVQTAKQKQPTKNPDPDDSTEASHLKNDVALQRLLQESSLLQSNDAHGTMPSSTHPATSSFNHIGKARRKALDMRMQTLGAEASLFEQKKRPLTHRFGMVEKRRMKEEQRRKNAKENGIILEKEVKVDREKGKPNRIRGVGAPAVGRMRGSTLVLSKSDIRQIQGPSKTRGKKGRGR